MKLTPDQIDRLARDGYVLLPNRIAHDDLALLRARAFEMEGVDSEDRLLETGGGKVRAMHGCHLRDEIMANLVRNPDILLPAKQILGPDIYVYQFKINPKKAFHGGSWDWHQDYTHWKEEDGLLSPRLINIAIYLDDVTEFNGPIFVIPGSHRKYDLNCSEKEMTGWSEEHRADIRHALDLPAVHELIKEHGIESTSGPAGSVLIFDVNVVHGSTMNISPFDRRIIFVTYNAITNVPSILNGARPEYLVGRDFTPL